MKKVVFLVLFFLISSVVFSAVNRYVYISKSDYTTSYLDTGTIRTRTDKVTNETYIDCWYKDVYNNKGVSAMVKTRIQYHSSIVSYENFSYTINHILMKQNRQYLFISAVDYAKDGTILGSNIYDNKKWQDVVPESIMETLYDSIVKWIAGHYNLNSI
jgi:hypothetical protein